MSTARELLKRWTGGLLLNDQIYRKLKKETEDLLAEPEQEPEPVAWMYRDKRNSNNTWAIVISMIKPDDSVHIKELTPLYTSPSKREPLDLSFVKEQSGACLNHKEGFIYGVRYAETSHGIGL